jgi:hypothetical protein
MLRFAYTSQHPRVLFCTVACKCVAGTRIARQSDGWGLTRFCHYTTYKLLQNL